MLHGVSAVSSGTLMTMRPENESIVRNRNWWGCLLPDTKFRLPLT